MIDIHKSFVLSRDWIMEVGVYSLKFNFLRDLSNFSIGGLDLYKRSQFRDSITMGYS